MEWVVFTARSVDEAKELALDHLGVGDEDAEFEVLEEPRAGLFGRVRGEAKVRARVRPTAPRAKAERRDRRRSSANQTETRATTSEQRPQRQRGTERKQATMSSEPSESAPETGEVAARAPRRERPAVSVAEVGDEAVRFIDGLLGAFGLEGSTKVAQTDNDLDVTVTGDDLGVLIGPRGTTLLAVQDLVRVASQRRLGDHDSHLRLDIGGYRDRRREALTRFATQVAEDVKSSGVSRSLEPMPSADRKVVHDTIGNIEGVASRSEGDDPYRRVVVVPA